MLFTLHTEFLPGASRRIAPEAFWKFYEPIGKKRLMSEGDI